MIIHRTGYLIAFERPGSTETEYSGRDVSWDPMQTMFASAYLARERLNKICADPSKYEQGLRVVTVKVTIEDTGA